LSTPWRVSPPQAALVGQIPDADAVNLQNGNAIDGPDNTVQADIWDGVQGQLRQMFVRVEAVPTSPGTGNANFNARKLQAAQNTSTMVRLNTPINAWGDRRIIERTYAWLRAVGTLQLLLVQLAVLQLPQNAWMQQLFPGPNPTADVWNRVADAAEQGYYSVWVNVFKRFGVANPGPGNNNLASDLVTLLNNRVAVNTPFRYRGTNLQNSVIAQLPNL